MNIYHLSDQEMLDHHQKACLVLKTQERNLRKVFLPTKFLDCKMTKKADWWEVDCVWTLDDIARGGGAILERYSRHCLSFLEHVGAINSPYDRIFEQAYSNWQENVSLLPLSVPYYPVGSKVGIISGSKVRWEKVALYPDRMSDPLFAEITSPPEPVLIEVQQPYPSVSMNYSTRPGMPDINQERFDFNVSVKYFFDAGEYLDGGRMLASDLQSISKVLA